MCGEKSLIRFSSSGILSLLRLAEKGKKGNLTTTRLWPYCTLKKIRKTRKRLMWLTVMKMLGIHVLFPLIRFCGYQLSNLRNIVIQFVPRHLSLSKSRFFRRTMGSHFYNRVRNSTVRWRLGRRRSSNSHSIPHRRLHTHLPSGSFTLCVTKK